MAYQITLTDAEYAALAKLAAERGAAVDTLVHEAIAEWIGEQEEIEAEAAPQSEPENPLMKDPVIAYMLKVGHIRPSDVPTRYRETPEEWAERERLRAELAARVKPGNPSASEMVIEDRGPR